LSKSGAAAPRHDDFERIGARSAAVGPPARASRAPAAEPWRTGNCPRTDASLGSMADPRPGQILFEDQELLLEEEIWAGDEADHAGWFCVSTDPFPCPASGCSFVAVFMTAAHLV